MPKLVIDWDKALSNVGDDRDFLDEVIQDFVGEAEKAQNLLSDGLKRKDFALIMTEAHKVKGSASYLSCDELEYISSKLQDYGHEGKTISKEKEPQLWRDIEGYI